MKYLMLLLFMSPIAHSQDFQFSAGPEIKFPLSIGLRADLEIYESFGVFVGYGFIPEPFVGVINEVGTGFQFYDSVTAELIDDFLPGANVFEFGFRLSHLLDSSFHLEASYIYAENSADSTTGELLEILLGISFPSATTVVELDAAVDSFYIGGAYEWEFWQNLPFTLHFGILKTLSGSATAFIENRPVLSERTSAALDEYLDDLYADIFIPIVAADLSYRF